MTDRETVLRLMETLSDEQVAALLQLIRRGLPVAAEHVCDGTGDAAFSDWMRPEEDEAWRHLQRVP
jgi:hypothetical protein